jgi:hypothetical protein
MELLSVSGGVGVVTPEARATIVGFFISRRTDAGRRLRQPNVENWRIGIAISSRMPCTSYT